MESLSDNLVSSVTALQNAGIEIYVVGFKQSNRGLLKSIASYPDREHIFILQDYSDVSGLVNSYVTACKGN